MRIIKHLRALWELPDRVWGAETDIAIVKDNHWQLRTRVYQEMEKTRAHGQWIRGAESEMEDLRGRVGDQGHRIVRLEERTGLDFADDCSTELSQESGSGEGGATAERSRPFCDGG